MPTAGPAVSAREVLDKALLGESTDHLEFASDLRLANENEDDFDLPFSVQFPELGNDLSEDQNDFQNKETHATESVGQVVSILMEEDTFLF